MKYRPNAVTLTTHWGNSDPMVQMGPRIRFATNPAKTLEALVLLASERPNIDVFHTVKVLFYADKEHLSQFGRPVAGDAYIAMEHGPVPSLAYDLLKRETLLGSDLIAAVDEALDLANYPKIRARRTPNLDLLSGTDVSCLKEALRQYGALSFAKLRDLVHAEAAWQGASVNSEMDWALILDEKAPKREELLEHLREVGARLVF